MTMAQVMILFYISSNNLKNQYGLTLLEMLVVVFILSAIALMTLSFTNNADDQFRFEDTRTRLGKIRIAAVGEPERTINGGPAISGFVADIGRLPNTDNLQELIEQGGLPVWTLDTASGVWAGWRGPYLASLIEQGGTRTYRDGWGNAGGAPKYGWNTFSATDTNGDGLTDTLQVVSYGSDGAPAGAGYAADYPPVTGNLAGRDDHQVNITVVKVRFHNPAAGAVLLPLANVTLLVRLHYPQNGTITSADSGTVTLLANSIGEGSSTLENFTFNKWVPWGVRALEIIDTATNTIYAPNATLDKIKLVTIIPRTQLPFSTDTDPMEWWLE